MTVTVAGMAFDAAPSGMVPSAITSPLRLSQLPEIFLNVVGASGDPVQLQINTAIALEKLVEVLLVIHAERDAENNFILSQNLISAKTAISADEQNQILTLCGEACSSGRYMKLQLNKIEAAVAIIMPVLLRERPSEALVAVLPGDRYHESSHIAVLQFAAAHITLWHALHEASVVEREAQSAAALVEILGKLATQPDLSRATAVLVNHLKEYFHADHVALGICHRDQAPCRLAAISGVSVVERRGELPHCLEAAMEETIARGTFTAWPPANDAERHALMTYKKLVSVAGSNAVIGMPLHRPDGTSFGAIVVLGSDNLLQKQSPRYFLRGAAEPLVLSLDLLQRNQPGLFARLWRRMSKRVRSAKGKIAIGILVGILVSLCIPWPYRIGCDCQLQPVTRRFAVAPYAGILEKTFAEPGNVVSKGQVLARMDGREIRWELAGLQAEYDRAAKQHDVAMSGRHPGAEQIATLEMQRLEQKIELLRHRQETLDIVSPFDGVILSGDLRQVQGAPLSTGQVLYEIAPLENMIVELEVPEEDIAYVEPGQEVSMRFEAFPWETQTCALRTVHPRLEIREHRAVFIAETGLANKNDLFRPGMRGQAHITSAAHPLGWNIFHRSWDWVLFHLGW